MKNLKAFTLAEIIVVISLLGIVAALTIPSVIKNQTQRANKTKIKKAMAAYENVVEKILVENNLPRGNGTVVRLNGNQMLSSPLKNFISSNNCENARNYFKAVELENEGNNCRFRAADGLWWDVTDITNTLVAFNLNDLNYTIASGGEYKAFRFVTKFDSNGAVRTNDLTYSKQNYNPKLGKKQAGDNPTYYYAVTKTYSYINNEQYNENIIAMYSQPCTNGNRVSCTVYSSNVVAFYDCWNTIYDEHGREVGHTMFCGEKGNPYTYTNVGTTTYYSNGNQKEGFDDCNFDKSYCTYIGFYATNGTKNNWYGGNNCTISGNKAICQKLATGRTQLCADNESIEPCPDNPEKNCYVFMINQDEYKLTNDLWAPKS